MSYNSKNYMEQGAEKWVIGGALEVKESAVITGLTAPPSIAANENSLGGVKAAPAGIEDTVEIRIGINDKLYAPALPMLTKINALESGATLVQTVAAFNALLTALKTAGLMSDE